MRKFLAYFAVLFLTVSCFYDDTDLRNGLTDLEQRVEILERACNEINSNLDAINAIINALENQDYITDVSPMVENGLTIGYTIRFAKGNPIVVYHGKDGSDGKDGVDGSDGKDGVNGKDGVDGEDGKTPVIGVRVDADGIYYWTLDGEWLLDDRGNRLPVTGNDGRPGENGKDGKDGMTPKLKIEEGYWYISYDNGISWTRLDKATGEDGEDGNHGIQIDQDELNVYFILPDGSVITIKKNMPDPDVPDNPEEEMPEEPVIPSDIIKFVDNEVKKICVSNWDTNKDGELSYEEAAAVKKLNDAFKNTGIHYFEEFQYFTGLYKVEDYAFFTCRNLANIKLPKTIEIIGKSAFGDCGQLSKIEFPSSLVELGESCFYDTGLLDVKFPEKLQVIPSSAFLSTNIYNLTIPGNIKVIETHAFDNCDVLRYVKLGQGVNDIKASAFSGCNNLTSIIFPESLLSIGDHAFAGCGFKKITNLPYNLSYIGQGAFRICQNLTEIIIPDNVVSIGDRLFEDCGNLSKVILSESLTEIHARTFCNCKSLQTIEIPNLVMRLGDQCFLNCENLTSVYFKPLSVPSIKNAFYGELNRDLKLYVPVESFESYRSNWTEQLDRIVAYNFEKGEVVTQ